MVTVESYSVLRNKSLFVNRYPKSAKTPHIIREWHGLQVNLKFCYYKVGIITLGSFVYTNDPKVDAKMYESEKQFHWEVLTNWRTLFARQLANYLE